MGKLAIHW